MQESEDLLPTLAYIEHRNLKVIQSVELQQAVGDCTAWMQIGSERIIYILLFVKRVYLSVEKLNPFGFIYQEWLIFKECITTFLLLEYTAIVLSIIVVHYCHTELLLPLE